VILRKVLFFIMVLFLVPVSRAFPWGAVTYLSPTHQMILTEAYNQLKKDPAFQESGFLPLQNILAQEGVNAVPDPKLDPYTWGHGPDAAGASSYQYHYYNPITKQGMADFAVNMYYKQLIDPMNSKDKSKAAAWSAHFLADMSVPYHIVGMTSTDALACKNNKTGKLSEEITGPLSLYDNNAAGLQPPVGWGGKNNFSNAIVNFVDDHSGGDVDWFDPWYSNGSGLLRNSHEVGTSSHVLWEKAAHKKYSNYPFTGKIPYETEWYNPAWKNAAPNFNFNTSVTAAQADQSAFFTRAVALYTRRQILSIHLNPQLGAYHAIRNVATLWRASITGLRPSIHYAYNDQDEYPTLECSVRNAADAIANNVRVKLFIQHKTRLIHEQIMNLGSIFPGGTGSVKKRLLIEPNTEYLVAIAVVAQYDIPDLQFAAVSSILNTKLVKITPAPVRPEPFNPDKIRKSWEGSYRLRSHHTGGRFKGARVTSTLTVSFNENNIPSVTFANTPVKIKNISETALVIFYEGENNITVTLRKQKDGSIEGHFTGNHAKSGDTVEGDYSSVR